VSASNRRLFGLTLTQASDMTTLRSKVKATGNENGNLKFVVIKSHQKSIDLVRSYVSQYWKRKVRESICTLCIYNIFDILHCIFNLLQIIFIRFRLSRRQLGLVQRGLRGNLPASSLLRRPEMCTWKLPVSWCTDKCKHSTQSSRFLAYHTNGRAYTTVLRPSVVCLSSVIYILWLNNASYRKSAWRSK